MPLVELRVPFELAREAIDDVERGADDSDWQPAKDAAEQAPAYAEDRAIFLGYQAAGIQGIREGTSNKVLTLPDQATDYPDVAATALTQLKLAGVGAAVLGAQVYTALQEANDRGYPVLNHIQRLVGSENIIWAPAIEGAYVLSTRGGDFALHLGADLSIGYLSHTDAKVKLYLEETLTFRLLTAQKDGDDGHPAQGLISPRAAAAHQCAAAAPSGAHAPGHARFHLPSLAKPTPAPVAGPDRRATRVAVARARRGRRGAGGGAGPASHPPPTCGA